MNELIFNILQVVVISAILAILRYLVPYLTGLLRAQDYNFAADIIETLVRSAEQTIIGYKRGTDKFDHVIACAKAQFDRYGIQISDDQLIQLLEAAVQAMNSEMGVNLFYAPTDEITEGEDDGEYSQSNDSNSDI